MWLPSQAQVNAFTRNMASGIGGAVLMFGLSNKIDVSAINQIITAAGTVVNDVVVLIGVAGPLIAGYFASKSASPKAQTEAVAATGALVVTSPEIAAASPSQNVVSRTDVAVVQK